MPAAGQASFPPSPRQQNNDSPSNFRRGTSDLNYIESPRLARAEKFAREREQQRNFENRAFFLSSTNATYPSLEDERHHAHMVASGVLDAVPLATTDEARPW